MAAAVQAPATIAAAAPLPGTAKATAALAFNPFTKGATSAAADGPLVFAANSAAVASPSLVKTNDTPSVPTGTAIFISDAAVVEPASGTTALVFTLTLSQKASVPVKVKYTTSNNTATAGQDYVAASGTVTFPAGVRTAAIAVTIKSDTKVEGTETFYVNLSNPNPSQVTIANVGKRATGTIFDEDKKVSPKLTLAAGAGGTKIVEGDTGFRNVNLKVFLSEVPPLDVKYTFKTVDGTATVKDNEYVPLNFQDTFAKGTKSLAHDVIVKIVGDKKKGKDETFQAVITNPVNATIEKGSVTITIVQDDF